MIKLAPTALLILSTLPLHTASAQYSGGTGDSTNPYRIATADDLNAIDLNPTHWQSHFVLTNDIDMQDLTEPYNPIGRYIADDDPNNQPFTGIFDGQNHTIANLYYTSADETGVGLFEYIYGENALITRVQMADPTVVATNGNRVGALAGVVFYSDITECTITGGSVTGQHWVGGLIGKCAYNNTLDCHVNGTVNGFDKVGGLVGYFNGGSPDGDHITRCSSAGEVTAITEKVGGLVGVQWWGTEVMDCHSTCRVQGRYMVGGLIGFCKKGSRTARCSAMGNVYGVYHNTTASDSIGGLVGLLDVSGSITPTIIEDSYATGQVDGHSNVGGLVGKCEGVITRSFSTGNVCAHSYGPVGGLAGVSTAEISLCRAQGNVELIDWESGAVYSGGLVGEQERAQIYDCYATGSVNGPLWVGGLVGTTRTNSTISNSYAVGLLTKSAGSTLPGGIVNSYSDTDVIACFWDIETTNTTYDRWATGLDTATMQMQSTFVDAGWDFDTIWWIDEGHGYPRFLFEPETRSDFDNDGDVDLHDFMLFQQCVSESSAIPTGCEHADIDSDADIDEDDLSTFIDACLNGPDQPVPNNCTLQ